MAPSLLNRVHISCYEFLCVINYAGQIQFSNRGGEGKQPKQQQMKQEKEAQIDFCRRRHQPAVDITR